MIRIKRGDLLAFALVLLPVSGLLEGVFTYYDEVVGLISMLYVIVKFLEKRLYPSDRIIVGLLMAVTVIGLISNVFSQLIGNLFAIAVDIVSLWKALACYIAFRTICRNQEKRERLILVLSKFAKFGVILAFVTALVGQVADIGVGGLNKTVIMGIKQYGFFWHNGIQTGLLLFSCIMILAASHISSKAFFCYLLLAVFPIVMTFSSLNYCWVAAVVVLLLILNKSSTIKLRYMVIMALGFLVVMASDLESYLNKDSVRVIWWQYGMITANSYLPFGSGFATFGTDMAAKNYSQLYIKYGWEHTWAFGRKSGFLTDNFLAGILGQFGWLGLAVYMGILGVLVKILNSSQLDKRTRIAVFATLLTILLSMIGTACVRSVMGVCVFGVLGICAGAVTENNQTRERVDTLSLGR